MVGDNSLIFRPNLSAERGSPGHLASLFILLRIVHIIVSMMRSRPDGGQGYCFESSTLLFEALQAHHIPAELVQGYSWRDAWNPNRKPMTANWHVWVETEEGKWDISTLLSNIVNPEQDPLVLLRVLPPGTPIGDEIIPEWREELEDKRLQWDSILRTKGIQRYWKLQGDQCRDIRIALRPGATRVRLHPERLMQHMSISRR